jgi:hypothetical protein
MSATANDCDNCWSSCRAEWAASLRGPARTPPTPRLHIDFSGTTDSEANILAGHFASTRERFVAGSSSPVLVLHDTTEFSYRHEDTAPMRIDKAFDWNFLGALDDEYCLIVHAILFAHLPQALVLIDGVF